MSTEPADSVTARRMMLGVRLRRLREECRISRADAGYTIRASESKISRLELGRVSFKERDVADLLVLYGVTDPDEREKILQLAQQANHPPWWRAYEDVMPGWFQDYIGLEQAAETIHAYETHFVPGLLQTDAYSTAVISGRLPTPSPDNLERAVELRSQRKQRITQPDAPTVYAIVDEAALRRPVGSEQIRRAQLEHLLRLTEHAHVCLQVLPVERSARSVGCGAFTILQFAQTDLPDMVYVEQLLGALYIDRGDQVNRYTQVYQHLADLSLSTQESVDFLTDLITGSAERRRPPAVSSSRRA